MTHGADPDVRAEATRLVAMTLDDLQNASLHALQTAETDLEQVSVYTPERVARAVMGALSAKAASATEAAAKAASDLDILTAASLFCLTSALTDERSGRMNYDLLTVAISSAIAFRKGAAAGEEAAAVKAAAAMTD
eukprot:7802353-Heterocapsa_arctica.AAC.1